jgi:hypothetical protein
MTDGMGMIINIFVAFLLMLTIGYCMMLNRRLKLLKADEDALRGTIAELVTATEIAERAIGGLKTTARECDTGLSERLARAERLCTDLDRKLAAGKGVLGLPQPPAAVRRANESSEPPQDPQAIAAAAQAFAERLRNKVFGLAA